MSSPRLAGVLIVAAVTAAVGLSRLQGDEPRGFEQWATRRELPNGPGRESVERGCLVCHSAMLITQQRKDSTGWAKTIGQMEQWGAPIPEGSRDSVQVYLVHHFGPRDRVASD